MNGRKRKAIATLYVVRDVDSIPAFLPLVFQSLYGLVLEGHQLIVTRTVMQHYKAGVLIALGNKI